jgi:hypothetical protein
MQDDGHDGLIERQARLKETFLDLGNAFVRVRMAFLRMTGVQPPDEREPDRRRSPKRRS